MSSDMDSTASAWRVYSGHIIGAVVKALNLSQGVLNERTAQRFFAGYSISDHNRTEILIALGEAFVKRGIVPVPPGFAQYDISMPKIIGAAVARAAAKWDNLMSGIQSRSGTIRDIDQAISQFLRIVVIDVAVRVFALLRLAGLEPSTPDTPSWAQENGGGKLLRRLATKSELTRDQLAARLEVSYTSIDNWLDGKVRPTPENIAALADVFASRIANSSQAQLEQDIHRQFTFAHLADLLEPWIGRDQVIDLATTLVRFVWLMTEDVRAMDRPPIEEAAGVEFNALRFGTADPMNHTLLRNLAQVEANTSWKKDIHAAISDWNMAFELVATQATGSRSAAGLAQDILDISTPDPAQGAVEQLADETRDLDFSRVNEGNIDFLLDIVARLESGIARRRAIVESFPLSPLAHYQLGSFLGMAGKHLMNRYLVNEGIMECKISSGLLPNWDAPAVEPGIILANIGQLEDSLRELHQAEEALPDVTPHLSFVFGYVLMKMSRHVEALGRLEEVLKVRPDYARASLYAARCSFALGNKSNGIRHAKNARRFGEPGEYIAWKNGVYSSRKKSRRAND